MSTLSLCKDECRQCAGLFRLGRDVEAALTMVDVFEKAQQCLASAPAGGQQVWAQLLLQMLDCQERQDWLGLADYMEYELIELLESVPA
jgi:ribulose-5-phosphate 4-epimerase/fuculose-1-phosphate aldolase